MTKVASRKSCSDCSPTLRAARWRWKCGKVTRRIRITVPAQVKKLRQRFGLKRLVLVGDRGMITSARIREDFCAESGISWITALRASSIQKLAAAGALQLSLFDTTDLAEIAHPDYPGERLVVCFNPVLSEER